MDPIYNIGIATYRNAVRLAAAFRKPKAKLMLRGQRRCFRTLQRKLDPSGGYIWIHASSLGEFEQGRPLIEMIKRKLGLRGAQELQQSGHGGLSPV